MCYCFANILQELYRKKRYHAITELKERGMNVNPASIYHRTDGNLCYALDEERLMIRIRTGYDVERVILVYGDPYLAGIAGGAEHWSGERLEMTHCTRLKYQLLWSVVVKPEAKRCKYYFELVSGDETWYYFENDFLTKEQMEQDGRMFQYFIFPWMNAADLTRVPKWVKNVVWYQIFPDRFCNGNPARNPQNVSQWETRTPGRSEVFGGDLEGIMEKIPYLKDLGIGGVYLNPVFLARSNHKYDTIDYEIVDPEFGDNQTLKELIRQLHEAGIRVMMDGVFNHCGFLFAPWQDVLRNGPKSRYYHWFMVNRWPFAKEEFSTRGGQFYSFAFFAGMPKLNTNHPEVASYFIRLCRKWVEEYEVDGIRFDVGNEVSHAFLKQLRLELKRINPDVYLLGEIWHDSISWMRGDEYDSVMNYPFVSSINEFWLDPGADRRELEYAVNRCFSMYQKQQTEILFNLLDSHDTDRLFTRVGENRDIFYQQLVMLLTMPGSPCIYYGTEVALPGGHDPDCRRCMPWEEIASGQHDTSLLFVKTLIGLRKALPACRSMNIRFLYETDNDRLLSYEKEGEDGSRIRVMLNCSQKAQPLAPSGAVVFSNRWDGKVLDRDGFLILRLPGVFLSGQITNGESAKTEKEK